MKNKIKILITAAEVSPLVKIGGLADVIGSFPKELNNLNTDTRIIVPLYQSIDKKKFKLKKIIDQTAINYNNIDIFVNIWQTFLPKSNTIIYFIENDQYFSGSTYSTDNENKFFFFSYACLSILPTLNFSPDIIHCHDYHTASIPFLLKKCQQFKQLSNIKTVFTIHNLAYQGITNSTLLNQALIKWSKSNQKINLLEQGIIYSDIFTTVSPTYAEEIKTSTYGVGLEKIIKKYSNKLQGIINGIDYDFFNPITDILIKHKYTPDITDSKKKNKSFIQKQFNLPQAKNIPLVGLVSRLVSQKGFDLFTEQFASLDCQFIILGTGEKSCEEKLLALANKYPNKFSIKLSFDEKLAHQIYAGCDIFAMPSRFEPCGLGQMIAMRYGTVPVVIKKGGLNDTVNDKNGFTFTNADSISFHNSLQQAIDIYKNKPLKWLKIQNNCLTSDFSWLKSAKKYIKLYQILTKS